MQVTCLFYLIDATTKDVVEGGKAVAEQRPPWLGRHALPFKFFVWYRTPLFESQHTHMMSAARHSQDHAHLMSQAETIDYIPAHVAILPLLQSLSPAILRASIGNIFACMSTAIHVQHNQRTGSHPTSTDISLRLHMYRSLSSYAQLNCGVAGHHFEPAQKLQ